ncbi:hypothetical protein [Limosilactobacillus reuteri]|nr:hypothetical protein [Limosilactobacillus reuteri]
MRFIIFDAVVLFVALIGSIIEKRKIDKQEKNKGGRHSKRSSF